MDLKDSLLEEHSKAQTLLIVDHIGKSKKRFADLMDIFFANEHVVTARAAWVVSYIADAHPELVKPYLDQMIENLRRPVQDAVKRNTLRLLQEIEITDDQTGHALDLCFPFMADPNEPAAVRAYAMTICHRICKTEPALAPELKLVIESCFNSSPAAFKSRGRKFLKELDKMIENH